jgi:hypothetical protein
MWEWRYNSTILNLDSFTPRLLYYEDSAPGIHWPGGWAGQRADLDTVEKRKTSCPYWESNPAGPDRSIAAIPTELSRRLPH